MTRNSLLVLITAAILMLVLILGTGYAQEERESSSVPEAKALRAWRDYLKKHKPTQEEKHYASLETIVPDQIVVVPIEPYFALTVQEILGYLPTSLPESVPRSKKVLLVSYSFDYGSALWRSYRPVYYVTEPPEEFKLTVKLRLYMLDVDKESLVAYPEKSLSTNTSAVDIWTKDSFKEIDYTLTDEASVVRGMIENAREIVNRVLQVIDGDQSDIDEDIRRRIALLQIKEGDWQLRQRGAEQLVRTISPEVIESLTGLLKEEPLYRSGGVIHDKYLYVRWAVVEQLAYGIDEAILKTIGNKLLPLFHKALSDRDDHIRIRAVSGLRKIGSPEALEAILEAAKDDYAMVRGRVADELRHFNDPKAIQVLIELLDDNRLVAYSAVCSLEHLEWKPDSLALQVRFYLAKAEIREREIDNIVSLGKDAIPSLIEEIKSENAERVEIAANALGKIGDPKAVEPLITLLADSPSKVRFAAAEALQKLNWSPSSTDEKVRFSIATGDIENVVKMGKAAIGPIVGMLAYESSQNRLEAIRILGQLGGGAKEAVIPLCGSLRSESTDECAAAAKALGKIGDASASDAIQRALENREKTDKAALWMYYALAKFEVQRDEQISMLAGMLSSSLAEDAEEALSKLELDVETISKLLAASDPKKRKYALGVIRTKNVGDHRITEELWKWLAEETDKDMREKIRAAIRAASGEKKE